MNRFNACDAHAVYCVGGRLYNTICLTPTSLRLEDLLDGQCLLFTRDEARQMIQQQDLIKVMPSALRRLWETDPRYRRRLPAWKAWEDREPWAVSTVQRAEEAQRPLLTPSDAPGGSGQGRKVAVERLVRCTTFFSGTHDGLTHHPDCRAAERQQMILLDEFSRIATSETIQTQILALLKRYVLTLRLCIYSGYIRSFHDHTSNGSAPNGRPATTGAARSASSRHRAIVRQQRGRRPH
jgi:hypothetical protein